MQSSKVGEQSPLGALRGLREKGTGVGACRVSEPGLLSESELVEGAERGETLRSLALMSPLWQRHASTDGRGKDAIRLWSPVWSLL